MTSAVYVKCKYVILFQEYSSAQYFILLHLLTRILFAPHICGNILQHYNHDPSSHPAAQSQINASFREMTLGAEKKTQVFHLKSCRTRAATGKKKRFLFLCYFTAGFLSAVYKYFVMDYKCRTTKWMSAFLESCKKQVL